MIAIALLTSLSSTAPVVEPASLATDEDTAAATTIVVTPPEAQPDAPAPPKPSFRIHKAPRRGTATIDDGGRIAFTPAPNDSGNDELTVEVSTGEGKRREKTRVTVPITVRPVNDACVVEPMALQTREEQPTSLPLTVRDVDSTSFTFSVVTPPGKGSASVDVKGRVRFAPAKDANGADFFVVGVNDGVAVTEARVDVVIASVNDAPVVGNASVVGAEDEVGSADVVASDVDGDAVVFAVSKNAGHGTAAVDAKGHVTFSPQRDWFGSDVFEVTAKDPSGASAVSTVSVSVTPVNDPPVVEAMLLSLREEQSTSLRLTVRDVDGAAPQFKIGTPAARGTASVDDRGRVTFTGAKDQNGKDRFVVVVSDGTASVDAPVDVVIDAVNDAPVISAASLAVDEDGSATVVVAASDVDKDVLAFAIDKGAEHGTAVVDPKTGAVTFTPARDWHGSDAIGVRVSDASTSATTTVAVSVKPVNDAPVIEAMALQTREDQAVSLPLTVRDVDGDTPRFSIGQQGAHGMATVDAKGRVTFSPTHDDNGSDRFVVVVSDGTVNVDAPVVVSIAPVNDAPTATAGALSVDEDGSATVVVSASDVDKDVLAFAIDKGAEHGSAVVDSKTGAVTFTPSHDWHGSDSVSVRVSDASTSVTTSVALTVKPVNDAPVIEAMALQTREDQPVSLSLTVRDVDGDTPRFSIGKQGARGSASVDGKGRVTFTPSHDDNGKDRFVVVVTDGVVNVDAPVDVAIEPVNDAPIATAGAVSVDEDGRLDARVAGTDVDGDVLSYSLVRGPAGASIARDGTLSWSPPRDMNGKESLTFEVDDGRLRSRADVAITVVPVNDAPRLSVRPLSTREDKAGSSVATATDIDGDTLKFRVARAGSKGDTVIGVAAGAITYTPKADENGSDVVIIAVDDGTTTTEVPLDVSIGAEPDAPRVQAKTWSLREDSSDKTTLPAIDVDGDALTFALVGANGGAVHGTVRLLEEHRGLVLYTPNLNENGKDEIRFEVKDGNTGTVAGSFAVDLAAVNDAPTAAGIALATAEDTVASGTIAMADVDGDALQLTIATPPKRGTVKIVDASKGTFTVLPAKDDTARFEFTMQPVEKQKGGLSGEPVRVSVDVSKVNDAPVAKAQSVRSDEDKVATIRLVATDVDGDTLTYSLVQAPRLGTVTVDKASGTATYTPRKNTYGQDEFVFGVKDGEFEDRARVDVGVVAVDDVPVAVDGVLNSPRAGRVTGTLLGRDPEGASLRFAIVSQPAFGKVTLLDEKTGAYAFFADGKTTGHLSFSFTVSDGTQTSAPATIEIALR